MAVAPKFASHILSAVHTAPCHTLELCKHSNVSAQLTPQLTPPRPRLRLPRPCARTRRPRPPLTRRQFSAKLFATVHAHVLPLLAQHPGLRIVLRHQVQPWHPSSTLAHEAALAVARLAPAGFVPFSAALFARQREFFDVAVVHEARNQTYARLAALAAEAAAVDAAAVMDLLRIPDAPGPDGALNAGNKVRGRCVCAGGAGGLTG